MKTLKILQVPYIYIYIYVMYIILCRDGSRVKTEHLNEYFEHFETTLRTAWFFRAGSGKKSSFEFRAPDTRLGKSHETSIF